MTPTQRAAMEQALDCLEQLQGGCTDSDDGTVEAITVWCPEIVDALRAALAEQPAEPQDPVAYNGWVLREVLFDNGEPVGHREPTKAEPQEPVAWCHLQYNEDGTYFADCLQHYPDSYGNTPLYAAPQPAKPAEQRPVAHDEDLLERLYWEFDRQRKKTGEERLAFKGKMRFYASDFRRVSIGKAAFSQSVTDDMMNLADRLGSEYDDVDPKAWKHLLVYAPQPAKRVPLTDEELRDALRQCPHDTVENLRVRWLYAKDFARAIERAHGIGEQE